ncbi:unnamed protein product [Caenorhabditis sp. 36 PRJEB53466]|nr:unnamed protein product [Caenorhabditis sp. 36 PRJEB53466]
MKKPANNIDIIRFCVLPICGLQFFDVSPGNHQKTFSNRLVRRYHPAETLLTFESVSNEDINASMHHWHRADSPRIVQYRFLSRSVPDESIARIKDAEWFYVPSLTMDPLDIVEKLAQVPVNLIAQYLDPIDFFLIGFDQKRSKAFRKLARNQLFGASIDIDWNLTTRREINVAYYDCDGNERMQNRLYFGESDEDLERNKLNFSSATPEEAARKLQKSMKIIGKFTATIDFRSVDIGNSEDVQYFDAFLKRRTIKTLRLGSPYRTPQKWCGKLLTAFVDGKTVTNWMRFELRSDRHFDFGKLTSPWLVHFSTGGWMSPQQLIRLRCRQVEVKMEHFNFSPQILNKFLKAWKESNVRNELEYCLFTIDGRHESDTLDVLEHVDWLPWNATRRDRKLPVQNNEFGSPYDYDFIDFSEAYDITRGDGTIGSVKIAADVVEFVVWTHPFPSRSAIETLNARKAQIDRVLDALSPQIRARVMEISEEYGGVEEFQKRAPEEFEAIGPEGLKALKDVLDKLTIEDSLRNFNA